MTTETLSDKINWKAMFPVAKVEDVREFIKQLKKEPTDEEHIRFKIENPEHELWTAGEYLKKFNDWRINERAGKELCNG